MEQQRVACGIGRFEGVSHKYMFLNLLFVTSLIIANVVSNKILQLGPLQVPGAAICYCITFLCTDIIGELYGKQEANKTVKFGFLCQFIASALILFTQYLPSAGFAAEVSQAYDKLLGSNWRFFIASMVAYWVSQSCDVYLFHKLRAKTNGTKKWLRNNLSTMTSQLLDTIIFITIAFYGKVPDLGLMIISQYVLKLILALLDTPAFYWFTRKPDEVLSWRTLSPEELTPRAEHIQECMAEIIGADVQKEILKRSE